MKDFSRYRSRVTIWMSLWGFQVLLQACYNPRLRQEAAETDTDGKSSNSLGESGGVTAGPNSGTTDSTTGMSESASGTTSSTTGTSSPMSDTLPPPTTGTTNGVMELCYNGIDDDGDNLIDCEDEEDCIDSICVPEPPPGWSELGVFQDAEAGSLSDCIEPYGNLVLEGGHQPNAKDAECTPCECGNAKPKPTGCPASGVLIFNDNPTCLNPYDEIVKINAGCQAVTNKNLPTQSLKFWSCVGSIDSEDGTCSLLQEGSIQTEPWSWTKENRFCGFSQLQSGGGCSLGNICVPKPNIEFKTETICISRTDDVACPESYSKKYVFYQSLEDTRGCTECTCNYSAEKAWYDVKGYEGTTCTGNLLISETIDSITDEQMCYPNKDARSFTFEVKHLNSTCNPSVSPEGSVTPKDPVTVCCNNPE